MLMNLSSQWTMYLQTQPESGMGYQKVHITFDDGTTYYTTVMNCQKIDIPLTSATKTISSIQLVP
jgi:hypothetical protein